jgi:hypothetical protein
MWGLCPFPAPLSAFRGLCVPVFLVPFRSPSLPTPGPIPGQYYGLACIAGFHFAVEARRYGASRTVARAFVHMGDFFTNGSHVVSPCACAHARCSVWCIPLLLCGCDCM